MADRNPLDDFRRALSAASRAIARDREVEVAFASEPVPASGRTARVPSPGPSLQPKLVAEARGAADAVALRLRYHDERQHLTGAPLDPDARAVFDALESARVEALGARTMDGVRGNLAELIDARIRGDAILRARSADEVPLATAIALLARERLTGDAPPLAARSGLDLITPWIEEKAGVSSRSKAHSSVREVPFGMPRWNHVDRLRLTVCCSLMESRNRHGTT